MVQEVEVGAEAGAEVEVRPKISDQASSMLRVVVRQFLADPATVDMGDWWLDAADIADMGDLIVPKCGTVGCIAGWIVALNSKADPYEVLDLDDLAQELLGLTHAQAFRLFYSGQWPEDLKLRLDAAPAQSSQYARVVADRVELFITTGGQL